MIDPGDEVPRILEVLQERDLKVTAIVHTHAHLDHIGGTAELCEHTHADSYLHPDDQMLHNLYLNKRCFLVYHYPNMDRSTKCSPMGKG